AQDRDEFRTSKNDAARTMTHAPSLPRVTLIVALIGLGWMGSEQTARGQGPDGVDQPSPELPNASETLDVQAKEFAEILVMLRKERQSARRWEVAFGITSGLVLAGFAGWRLIADPGSNQLSRGLGVLFTGFAALNLARGFTALRRPQIEEELSLRFDQALEDGLTEADVSRFEGELYATARSRWRARRVDRWFGFARAIGGAFVAGILPLTNANRSTRRSGYIVGSLFFSVGMIEFGRSFKVSAAERAWHTYQQLE
ncbi:MAG: hypothetical protein WBG86_03265, partial [Polyangiales bacterium]